MCFLTVDDLLGSYEVIVFESVFNKCGYAIEEEKIVLIEGKLSIREDEPTKIIASNIKVEMCFKSLFLFLKTKKNHSANKKA